MESVDSRVPYRSKATMVLSVMLRMESFGYSIRNNALIVFVNSVDQGRRRILTPISKMLVMQS